MRVYIPAPAARAMSDALWSLSRPAAVRSPNDVTKFLFPWQEATDGTQWLVVDTSYQINIHPLADATSVVAVLQPYEDSGALPAGTLEGLSAYVEANRGLRIVVYKAFPDYFKSLALTEAQMVAQGKFSMPSIS